MYFPLTLPSAVKLVLGCHYVLCSPNEKSWINSCLEATGQIDMDQLRKLEEAHISGKQDQSALIYALVVYGITSKPSQS